MNKDDQSERCGQVIAADTSKKMLTLYYQKTENNIMTDITEELSYDHPNISWYKDETVIWIPGVGWTSSGIYPTLKNPPELNLKNDLIFLKPLFLNAVGYTVEVKSHEVDAKEGMIFFHFLNDYFFMIAMMMFNEYLQRI
jgi:hypothetical protein